MNGMPEPQGLYDPANEHDNCGVGFLANIDGIQSHRIVSDSIEVLKNLLHRGAVGGDLSTGDGAGVLLQISDKFFRKEAARLPFTLPPKGAYGVGMLFVPQSQVRAKCLAILQKVIEEEALDLIGWREVPTDGSMLGKQARLAQPFVMQVFVGGGKWSGQELDRKLYVVRKQCQHRVAEVIGPDERFYIPSFSSRTIVYKGLLMGGQVSGFYKDLNDLDMESAVAVIHQRYSTNTFPSWELSQPFRSWPIMAKSILCAGISIR